MRINWSRLKKGAKAFVAGPAAGASYLLGVWSETENMDFGQAFSMLSPNQWLLFGFAVLGGWGLTYGVKNR